MSTRFVKDHGLTARMTLTMFLLVPPSAQPSPPVTPCTPGQGWPGVVSAVVGPH